MPRPIVSIRAPRRLQPRLIISLWSPVSSARGLPPTSVPAWLSLSLFMKAPLSACVAVTICSSQQSPLLLFERNRAHPTAARPDPTPAAGPAPPPPPPHHPSPFPPSPPFPPLAPRAERVALRCFQHRCPSSVTDPQTRVAERPLQPRAPLPSLPKPCAGSPKPRSPGPSDEGARGRRSAQEPGWPAARSIETPCSKGFARLGSSRRMHRHPCCCPRYRGARLAGAAQPGMSGPDPRSDSPAGPGIRLAARPVGTLLAQ